MPIIPLMPSNRIRELRKAAGLSLEALAERCATSAQQISRLERDERPLTLDWMRQLGAALGCLPADLLQPEDVGLRLDRDEAAMIAIYRALPPELRRQLRDIVAIYDPSRTDGEDDSDTAAAA